LYGIAALQKFRRSTYRYATEHQRIATWLSRIETLAAKHYDLALEVTQCQNLIKGYGDTHARGVKNFDRIMRTLDQNPTSAETAALIADLRKAALADEDGVQLEQRLAQVA
jgi:indolepyruvate ferredoxin oxidoreductase beta subunit